MRLNVIGGSRELLLPYHLKPELLESILGDEVRVARARWISHKCGERYHNFLQDEPRDTRTRVMGQAIRDEFGARYEPLVILPELLDELAPYGKAAPVADADVSRTQQSVLREIMESGDVREIRIVALALPANVDPEGAWAVRDGITSTAMKERLEKLRASDIASLTEKLQLEVLRIEPEDPDFSTVYNNALSQYAVKRLSPQLRESGWIGQEEKMAAAIGQRLLKWNESGLFLQVPLHHDHLDTITNALLNSLLSQ